MAEASDQACGKKEVGAKKFCRCQQRQIRPKCPKTRSGRMTETILTLEPELLPDAEDSMKLEPESLPDGVSDGISDEMPDGIRKRESGGIRIPN